MMNKISTIGLFLVATQLYAEPITLNDKTEIQRADELSIAIDNISEKVMACMEEPNGSRKTCACSDSNSCKFKKDFDRASTIYCAIKSDFPLWKGKIINYSAKGKIESNALSMEGLERQLGKTCK